MTNNTLGVDIDNNVGALEQALCDIFGITIDSNVTESPTSFDNSGRFAKALLRQAAAGPVGWRYRDTTSGKEVQIVLDGTNLKISENIGTEGTPSWTPRATMAIATGVWTFTAIPEGPSSDPTTDNQLVRKAFVTTGLGGKVSNTGDETISGVKTFNSSPIIPTPTTDYQPSTKKYVDDRPVGSAVKGLASNLIVSTTSDTAIAVNADEAVLEDSGYNYKVVRSVALTINTGVVGVNGIDTGAVAANSWYAVYIINNGTTTAGLISLSATSPAMPSGYTFKSRVGWVRTNTGAATLIRTLQKGNRVQYVHASGVPFPVICSGIAGDVSIPTWVAVSVSSVVPTTAITLIWLLRFSGGTVIVAPNNTYGAIGDVNNPPPYAVSTNSPVAIMQEWVLESTNVYWANNTAENKIIIFGWEDNL